MGRSKIQTISKNKSIDYGNEKVNNFWLKINEPSSYLINENLDKIIAIFDNIQDRVICIQTEELNHPKIIKAIFNASKKRNRIYILTNEKDKALQQLAGVCLIRYSIKNIGSFILANPNTSSAKGIIYTAPFIETSLANAENIALELDKGQINSLFRFFSDNFWNKAEFEIIDDYNNPKETGEPPLDFLPNIKDFCDADFVKKEILKINSDSIILAPNLQTNDILDFASLNSSTILTSLKLNDTKLINILANNENVIFANQTVYSRQIINSNGDSWLIPKTNIYENENFFALKLNNNQIDNLDNLINNKIDNAEYEFNLSKTRKELENKTIRLLDKIDNEIEIKSKTNINAKNIDLDELISKAGFEKQKPEFIDDNTSVKIDYSWQIIPFFTPQNAKKAKLYADWEKYQNEYKAFISQIEKAINKSESKNIGENLKHWFLGKKQTITSQQEELQKLKSRNLSILEITERKRIIKEINELAKIVSANLSEIDTEIKKSEIDTEIVNLIKEKEEKELKLSIYIEEQEPKLKEQKANREDLLNKFLEKYHKGKNELAIYKSDLQRKLGKKNRKRNPIEAEEAQKILDDLNVIQGFDFSKKYEEEKQKFEKEIKNIENKIISKEKERERVEKDNQQREVSSLNSIIGGGQNNKNSIQINEFSIPDEVTYLPKVGELFEVGKQKYLEIEFWEDFELGLTESQRLNTKLSAKNNS